MPAATKHENVLARIHKSRQPILDLLNDAGAAGLAESAKILLDYAEEQAERAIAKRANDSRETRSLRVTAEFRTKVHADAAEDGAVISDIVVQSLRDFVNGEWAPPAPQRAPRGTNLTKVGLNVRVPQELWDAANDRGKDVAEIAQRGYKLTAESVGIAALRERFGDSENTTA